MRKHIDIVADNSHVSVDHPEIPIDFLVDDRSIDQHANDVGIIQIAVFPHSFQMCPFFVVQVNMYIVFSCSHKIPFRLAA